jgi:tetratricopeptide (TPR) repeat protein
MEAARLDKPGGNPKLAGELRQQARQWTTAVMAHHGSDPSARLEVMQVLSNLGDSPAALEMLHTLHAELRGNPSDVNAVLQVAERLALAEDQVVLPNQTTLTAPNLTQARELLELALARHPHNLPLEVALARVLTLLGDQERATALLTPVLTRPLKATALDLVRQADLQRAAMAQLADLRIAAAARSAQPQADLAEAQAMIDRIAGTAGQVAAVDLLRGKLELARGQYVQAMTYLDRASAQFKDAHPETLLLSARARAQLGELGAAADRLNRLLALRPQYVPGRVELAGLHLRLGQTDLAGQQLEEVLKLDPQHVEARKLYAMALTQRGKLQQAIEVYQKLDPRQHRELVVPLAQLHQLSNDPAQARAVLEQRLDAAPGDLNVLREWLALVSDADQQAPRLARAKQAGVSEDLLTALAALSQGRTPDDPTALLDAVSQNLGDPVLADLARARLLSRLGKEVDAAAALARAAATHPDHPAVIEANFVTALSRSDWKTAESIAQRAATLNLDHAQGAFYQGQLELARGNAASAALALRRGLDLRPIHSDGWFKLGEALRLQGDLPGAASAYDRALALRPSHVPARKSLALLADQRGERAAALEQLRTAVRFAPTDRLLVQQYLAYEQSHGDVQRALSLRRQIAAVEPDDDDNLRGLALLLAQLNQHEQATAITKRLLAQQPDALVNVLTAAQVEVAAGHRDDAAGVIERYLKTRQPKPGTDDWLMAARLYLSMDDVAASEQAYRQAMVTQDAKTRPAARELADMLFSRARYADAATLYRELWDSSADRAVGLRAAESLLRAGDHAGAQSTLSHVRSKTGDDDASAWLLQAMIARAGNNPQTALAALQEAQRRQPQRALIHLELARLRLEHPDLGGNAMADLGQAIELDPDLLSARRLLAQTLLSQGDRDGAARELRSLLLRQPRDVAARRQLVEMFIRAGTLLPARTLLKEAEAIFPGDPLWARLRAQVAQADGKTAEALAHLETAFKASPTADNLGEWALALIQAQRGQDALDLLVTQMELVMASPRLQALHGRALWMLTRAQDAQAVWQQAAGHLSDPTDATVLVQQVSAATGADAAGSVVESLAFEAPQSMTVAMQLALADVLLDTGRPGEAADRLSSVQQQLPPADPRMPALLLRLALAHHQQGNADQAATLYRQILQNQPNDVAVLNNLAYLLAEDLNQPGEALPLAQRAAALAPRDPQVMDTLGWTLFRAGQKDQALVTLRRSVEIKRLAPNCYHLAEVLLDRRERAEALKLLDVAAKLARQSGDPLLLAKVNQRLKETEPLSEGHPR